MISLFSKNWCKGKKEFSFPQHLLHFFFDDPWGFEPHTSSIVGTWPIVVECPLHYGHSGSFEPASPKGISPGIYCRTGLVVSEDRSFVVKEHCKGSERFCSYKFLPENFCEPYRITLTSRFSLNNLTLSLSISYAMKFRFRSWQTFPTIPLPKNGSKTTPFSGQKHLMSICMRSFGFAGILPVCGSLKW